MIQYEAVPARPSRTWRVCELDDEGHVVNKAAESISTRGAEPAKSDVRDAWQQPQLRVFHAESAETGVNSTTDATATFS